MLSKKKRPLITAAMVALLVVSGSLMASPIYQGWQKGPWEKYDKDNGVTVYLNEDVPTGVDAVRVDAILPYPADQLFPIITDPERARTYSFIKEFRPIENHGNWGYLYQRVSATGVKDRDFTVRLDLMSPKIPNTGPYGWTWKQANDKGPPPTDAVRATVTSGSYILTPVENGTKTLVSYRLWFDPGTWVPDFLVNPAVRASAIETVVRLRQDARKKYGKK